MRTTDGGASWQVIDGGKLLRNAQIVGVAPRGAIIVVASDKGLFRSSEDGQWTKISGAPDSGLPTGYAFDLASDPEDPARLYTNAGAKGIFQSLDSGATWTKISDASIDQVLDRRHHQRQDRGRAEPHALCRGRQLRQSVRSLLPACSARATAEPAGRRSICRAPSRRATSPSVSIPAAKAVFIFRSPPTTTDPNIVYIGGDRQPSFRRRGSRRAADRLLR